MARKVSSDAFIFKKENTTTNEYGEKHSYDEQPAYIQDTIDSWNLKWFQNGLEHREKNLPSRILFLKGDDKKRPAYYADGVFKNKFHNEVELEVIQESYKVFDVYHRTDGPAQINAKNGQLFNKLERKVTKNVTSFWSLYGLRLPESRFNLVINNAKQWKVPYWVSLFYTLKLLDLDTLKVLKNDKSLLEESPIEWTLRAFGITFENFSGEPASENSYSVPFSEHHKKQFEKFLTVANYEQQLTQKRVLA